MKRMKNSLLVSVLLSAVMIMGCANEKLAESSIPDTDHKVEILVFSKTDGWRHDSIEAGQEAIKQLGEENDAFVHVTEDASVFNKSTLDRFDAVVFLNTTETIFNDDQREAFRQYIRNGGGFVGIHAATDTEYNWPWYNRLVGAYFDGHPAVQSATLNVVDSNHLSTSMLPEQWVRTDEWYDFRDFNEAVNILITIDPDSYEGSDHVGTHPMAWYHEFEGGRSFYTGLGHTIEGFSEDLYLQHLWGGIEYAIGNE